MRRVSIVVGVTVAVLAVATPASAFAHDRVTNPVLHAVFDVLSLAVVTAPLWTAYLWGGRRRGLLLALIAVVQLPVAVIAFVPIANPLLHTFALALGLGLTVASLIAVRRSSASSRAAAPESR
ncbi:MAG TPA: hypothetical protein VIL44_03960 [Micromonospora sp.]